MRRGPSFAIVSAALFGLSPALSKLVIGGMSPALLAGLLYLGSGIALMAVVLLNRRDRPFSALRRLSWPQRRALAGAVVFGGIAAPLCLAYGIKFGSAFEVSLLLNLEPVATAAIAWMLFREHLGRSVVAGIALLAAGGAALVVDPGGRVAFSAPGLAVIAACAFWGFDNNLTREVEDMPATELAALKGLVAGGFNIGLAWATGAGLASWTRMSGALGIGALSYGVSLVLFIEALRSIGSSRTGAYFATGPFIGMLASVALLGDRPPAYRWAGAALMAVGVWVMLRERHEHVHTHEELTHGHGHAHDHFHDHAHDGEAGEEPHDHVHRHRPVTHSHVHWPDIHHRHSHD